MDNGAVLKLVPPTQPDPRQAAIERIKRMENPREVLQCPRCGCRSYVNIYNGATLQGSKMRHGTAIDKCLCENCYRQGIKQSLLPDKPRAVKEPKPRRTKPKLKGVN